MEKMSALDKTQKVNNIKRYGAAIIAASLAALWIIFELTVFFVNRPAAPEIDFYEICSEEEGEKGYEITEARTLFLPGSNGAIETLSFEIVKLDGERLSNTLPKIDIYGYDPAAARRILYSSKKICIGDDGAVKTLITLDIPKGASDIALTFGHSGCDYGIENIKINSKGDVTFNFARCAIVVGVIALFGLCAHYKLWRIHFDGKKHGLYALAICLACVSVAILLSVAINPDTGGISYPLEGGVGGYNPYVQQFDAIQKGQLHIDVQPSDELLALENPYDYSARDGVYYLWDRAFYDGKYYSYFGMAPIFTVYFPYYVLTGKLPSDNTVSAIFTVLTSVFFSMAAVKWAAMRTKKIPLPLLLVGTLSTLFSTQIFLMARGYSRFYYIATVAGMAFMAMFIWLFLCGISGNIRLRSPESETPRWKKPLIFTFAGLAYGLCFLSRFNIALVAAFAIVPMLWFSVVTEKSEGEKRRLRPLDRSLPELVFLALPVLAAIGFQLWLNLTRFDSLFEFGTTYQLTVSDVSLNKLRITDLPAAIFHYFLQPILPGLDPPVMSLWYTSLNSYGHYVYVDTGMGLFSIPLTWALLGCVGVFMSKRRRLEAKITLASVIVGLVAVALFDFCLGGVIFRYTCDLTLMAAFASMAIVYALYEDVSERCGDSVCVGTNVIAVGLFALSLLVSLSLALSDNANLAVYSPELCSFFRALIGA